jgi:hypothetical protein
MMRNGEKLRAIHFFKRCCFNTTPRSMELAVSFCDVAAARHCHHRETGSENCGKSDRPQ